MLNKYIAELIWWYKESIFFHISYIIGFYVMAKFIAKHAYRAIIKMLRKNKKGE